MTTIDRPRRLRRSAGLWWLALSALAIAVLAPLPYLTSTLHDLAAHQKEIPLNYVDRPTAIQAALYLHISFGGLALLLSPLQLSSRFRARVPRLHRVAGRVTLVAIGIAAVAGALLSTVNSAGPIGTAGFGLLAVAWLGCAVNAFRAIRRRDLQAHRRWAIRTFALTYAAVTLRLWLGLLIPLVIAAGWVGADAAFSRVYPVTPFLCWVPNLLVAEWFLTRSRSRATQNTENPTR